MDGRCKDGEAVERHVLDECEVCRVHGVAPRSGRVLRVDICDDGDVGGQLEEGAVAFVGLHHHPVAGAEPGIGAVSVDDSALITVGSSPAASSNAATSEVVVVLP